MSFISDKTIKSPKVIITTHTSNQMTSSAANTEVIVTGSEIAYTPAPDSSKVIYEIMFYSETVDNNGMLMCRLQNYLSGSWSEVDLKNIKVWGIGPQASGENQEMRYCCSFRYILPAWSGERQLRLSITSHHTGREMSLHQLTNWDGSSATDQFCNTNLLVYSI
tara:strand:+ start:2432 stop:2923 length:492 start_codon:yes stop_codon:yes gene_type:complete